MAQVGDAGVVDEGDQGIEGPGVETYDRAVKSWSRVVSRASKPDS